MNTLLRRAILGATSLLGLFSGGWAAFAPQSFYDSFPGFVFGPWVAVDGPFNEHLVRDVGAFYLAFAAAGIFALLQSTALAGRVVGIAWLVFSVPHFAYHLLNLEGFSTLDAVGQVVGLGSTIVLAVPLILPSSGSRPRRDE